MDAVDERLARLTEADPALSRALADHRVVERLNAVLTASPALADHLLVHPGQWRALTEETHPEAIAAARDRDELRLAYRQGLLHVAARDLTGDWDYPRVAQGLSDLADLTLRAGLRLADPAPGDHRLAVIAMGKLGGRELNYVSDVDVVFAAEGDLDAAARAAARMMEICGHAAWPVDAGLRPEGAQGPLVRTLAAHLAYYKRWARTWEFQALIKARPVAGDDGLGREWLDALTPLVWTAADRGEVVDEVRAMRRRVEAHLPKADAEKEIKLGRGGLRDIEFAVQLLQLVHGRSDPALRSATTLTALEALTGGGYLGRDDGALLAEAYAWLRTVEHRIQLHRLRRTHRIPDDPTDLGRLARLLGHRNGEEFLDHWRRYAREVRRLHEKLFYRPLLEAVAKVPTGDLRLTPKAARERLTVLGYADPAGALRHISALTDGVGRTSLIQRQLLPVLLGEFADAPEPDRGLLAYRQISDALGRTPWYLGLMRDGGPIAQRLAGLLGTSRYVTDLLSRDPAALRMLADDRELAPRDRDVLADGMRAAAARHDDPATAVAAVRAMRRRELLRVASADLLGHLTLDQTGAALTAVTDAVLAAALTIVDPDGRLAVIGMGRLGGAETAYGSDADVLFVCADGDETAAAERAERLRALLSAPAPDPPLGVDADLRPEGRQGPLVRSLSAYRAYYGRWSRVWEAQALLRARFVAGNPELGAGFTALADTVRYPAGGLTAAQLTEIRRLKVRVDTERLPRGADPTTHTKLGRGGLSDVEWSVQLLQLRHGHDTPGLRTPATLPALSAAADARLIAPGDAEALGRAWRLVSRVRNALVLTKGKATDQLPKQGVALAGVTRALGRPNDEEPGAFLDEYLRLTRQAHGVSETVLYET
ncbi:glutamate-ammonia-ligase adenylyltransferase [Actinorhabdospora filicis]|uniref:Glutamate-ammonia-ligase adenylyltransferase n=1 Tax=Actinorhabdospora filicis TaxID=1785913 RepID=A0A9W6SJD9_9ACTN|nr:bifunctional [glutamine synthetase] adenylyltransferase/[glutamine synthetase]-adenylyl-L-tyrosine phosphorylase [Actinorhabdospora filicis]GLZ75731.1 glutamate-ammonia-ligase adenylyltransferase [Actinorhabdospora filicis]